MKTLRIVALVLHLFIGVGAAAGGLAAILDPIAPLGMPLEELELGPFNSFLVPGIILFGLLGLGNLAAAVLRFTKRPIADISGGFLGAAMIIWIVVQCWMLQGVVFLHVLFFSFGVLQGLIALILLWQENRFPMNLVKRILGIEKETT